MSAQPYLLPGLRWLASFFDSINRNPKRALLTWFALSAVLVVFDFVFGAKVQFPVAYLVPIAGAAWVNGRRTALLLSCLLVLVRMLYSLNWYPDTSTLIIAGNALLYLTVFASFSLVIDTLAQKTMQLKEEAIALQKENIQLETLHETMITVNDLVLNRLAYAYVFLDLVEDGKTPMTHQVELLRAGLDEITANLRALNAVDRYETQVVAGGRRAVSYAFVPKRRKSSNANTPATNTPATDTPAPGG